MNERQSPTNGALPQHNVGGEFCQMLHRCTYGQPLIGELFFSGKIVIQSILDTVPVRIDRGVAVQHPLFLSDVILPNLSGVTEHAFKQSAVDGEPLGGGGLEWPGISLQFGLFCVILPVDN